MMRACNKCTAMSRNETERKWCSDYRAEEYT
jgi:hypothetical protein